MSPPLECPKNQNSREAAVRFGYSNTVLSSCIESSPDGFSAQRVFCVSVSSENDGSDSSSFWFRSWRILLTVLVSGSGLVPGPSWNYLKPKVLLSVGWTQQVCKLGALQKASLRKSQLCGESWGGISQVEITTGNSSKASFKADAIAKLSRTKDKSWARGSAERIRGWFFFWGLANFRTIVLQPRPPLTGVSRALRARNPERVTKKSPGAFRPRATKSVRNSLATVSGVSKQSILRLGRLFWDCFGHFLFRPRETLLWLFRGFRARETPVRGGRGCKIIVANFSANLDGEFFPLICQPCFSRASGPPKNFTLKP